MKLFGNVGSYATQKSAGLDLMSTEEALLWPGEHRVFKTGVYIEPEENPSNECLFIIPKSGLAAKYGIGLLSSHNIFVAELVQNDSDGLGILNSPGLIDSDYPGEIGVILINHGRDPHMISVGDKIAQAVLIEYKIVENAPVSSEERTGGFGSTGK